MQLGGNGVAVVEVEEFGVLGCQLKFDLPGWFPLETDPAVLLLGHHRLIIILSIILH